MRYGLIAGSLFVAALALHARAQAPPATMVSGVIYDSLAFRGLSDATVQLMPIGSPSTVRTTKSDGAGNFEFGDVPFGSYLVGFFHPKLDSIGLTSPTARIDLRADNPVRAQLSIPAARTIARSVCGASFPTEDVGLLLGRVRGADDARLRTGANVTVSWADVVFDSGAVKRKISTGSATTNESGQFALCGVPLSVPVMLYAAAPGDSSGQFELTLPRTFVHRDIYVGPVSRVRIEPRDSTSDVEWLRGNGRLRGKVTGENERAIRNARVTVWGTGTETMTNPDGEFSLANLPPGTHTLEVRALGFSPAKMPVDIMGEQSSTQVELSPIAIALDTVRVTAPRTLATPRLQEVERRSRFGMGSAVIGEEIDKRNAWGLTDLLRGMRGVRLAPGQFGSSVILMRSKLGQGYCTPHVIVDNVPMEVGDRFPIDVLVPIDWVLAVEVYSGIVPPEFISDPNCGVIAITTGYRPRPRTR